MKKSLNFYVILIMTLFFVFTCVSSVRADSGCSFCVKDVYQQKVADVVEKKYKLNDLSEDELKIVKDTISIANQNNYKVLISIIKKDNLENLRKVADLKINENLKKANADKQSYETAYTIVRNGLFTEIRDEKELKPLIQTMYDCEQPMDEYKLAVYASVYLFHKEDKYDFKTLLDSTTKENSETLMDEIKSDAKFDANRFFPNNKEMIVIMSNLPKSMQAEIENQNGGKKLTLSPAKCIISPSYHIVNMMLVSMDMYGASKAGAFVGLINPLNILSDVALSPFYFLMGKLLKDPIKNIQEL